MGKAAKIAIVGAGLTGLTLARALEAQAAVTVFEKSHGFGGRMSTRRTEVFAFDHGAQCFSAKTSAFQAFLVPYLRAGQVQPWAPRRVSLPLGTNPAPWTQPRYVAVPGMTALARAMATGLDVQRSVHIVQMDFRRDGWYLSCRAEAEYGPFDWVISTAPAPQTAVLMPRRFAGRDALDQARMRGCYSLMLGFDAPLELGWDAAEVTQDPLAWVALDSSKPGRGTGTTVVAQASNLWSDTNLERDQEAVRMELIDAVSEITDLKARRVAYSSLHRWRFANVETPAGAPFLIDAEKRLAAAGDWCGSGKVEAAFESGTALATALMSSL